MTDNKRFNLIDNHLIMYDGDYFDLHKPSDIRSLIKVLNYVTNENEQLKQDKRRLVNYISKTFNLSDKAIQQLIIEDEFNDVK